MMHSFVVSAILCFLCKRLNTNEQHIIGAKIMAGVCLSVCPSLSSFLSPTLLRNSLDLFKYDPAKPALNPTV